ncbi:MAG: Pinin/SDK/MemA protein, partial [Piptocephalis tieghemiana]
APGQQRGPRLNLKDPQVREQGRRMFGLALGTLQSFQSGSRQTRSGSTIEGDERRRKLEERIQEKLMRERAMAEEKVRQREQELQDQIEAQRMVLEHEHQQVRHQHLAHLVHFLRTQDSPGCPGLYYLPAKLTPKQEAQMEEQK